MVPAAPLFKAPLRVRGAAAVVAAAMVVVVAGELPLFNHTYNMQQSTIAMPCNYTGFMDMTADIGRFGIIDFDWSNAKELWANAHPMNAEELLLDQAKRRKAAICPSSCPYPQGCPDKAACPEAKTWVYRNFVKALPWYVLASGHAAPVVLHMTSSRSRGTAHDKSRIINQNGATSGFKMCFAPGSSQHQRCWAPKGAGWSNQNTSRIQHKEV